MYQFVWGVKRKDYRSISNGFKGFVEGIGCIQSGVGGHSQWADIGANAGAAIDQAADIHRNIVLERTRKHNEFPKKV